VISLGKISIENALRNFGVTEKEVEVYIFLKKQVFRRLVILQNNLGRTRD